MKTLSSELSNTLLLPEQEVKTGDLHPMMDIFSAGCALTELYNEGHPPFDFSQLLGRYIIFLSFSCFFFCQTISIENEYKVKYRSLQVRVLF